MFVLLGERQMRVYLEGGVCEKFAIMETSALLIAGLRMRSLGHGWSGRRVAEIGGRSIERS